MVAARAAGEDVLGRRRIFANVDRVRTFGSSSLSGALDIFGVVVFVATAVIVGVYLTSTPATDHTWLVASLIGVMGVATALLMFATARMVTYAKACAVLLARMTGENA